MNDSNRKQEESDAVALMVETDGWKILNLWICKRIDDTYKSFMNCPLEEIERKRGYIGAYQELGAKIKEMIKQGNK